MFKLVRLKEWSRSRKFLVVAFVVVGLIAVIWGGFAIERKMREQRLIKEAQKLGIEISFSPNWFTRQSQFLFDISFTSNAGIYVGAMPDFDNHKLQQLMNIIEDFPAPITLTLQNCPGITDLTSLSNSQNISFFTSAENYHLTDLNPLGTTSNLKFLRITDNPQVTDWNFISNLTELEYLQLHRNAGITNLDFVENLTELTFLDVSNSSQLTDISAMVKCPKLTHVNFMGCTQLKEVNALFSEKIQLTGYFNLRGTSVPTAQILKLIERFPNCTIRHDKE